MVFYAYLDPQVITQAFDNRPYGYQCLVAMLRGFTQNCCIVDLDGRMQAKLQQTMGLLPNDWDRKEVKRMLRFLDRRGRFLKITTSGAEVGLPDLVNLACDSRLDVVITTTRRDNSAIQCPVEICSLADYQFTQFERNRSEWAHEGRTYSPGEYGEQIFLDMNFGKALRWAKWIIVCDRSLGMNFWDNYRYTVTKFVRWLRDTNIRPEECEVTFLCGEPRDDEEGLRKKRELKELLRECNVTYRFYRKLPHERFILTDQVALEIGRGMDFLDPIEGKNRDVSLSVKSYVGVTELFRHYNCLTA